MIEKDPNNSEYFVELFRQSLPYVTTFVLSCWGGVVSYFQRIRKSSKKFSWKELMLDLVSSSFAGFLTHLLCRYANVDDSMSAILIAISGHMGTRAIARFEKIHSKILGD